MKKKPVVRGKYNKMVQLLESADYYTAYTTLLENNLIDEKYAKAMPPYFVKFDSQAKYDMLRKFNNPIVSVNTIVYSMYKS